VKHFRFGIQLPSAATGAEYRSKAKEIEAIGYSTVFCPDHFDEQWSPTVALTIAAEATETLNVGSLVYDVDYRHPLVLAKELATLDLASEGRVEFGIGAGWMEADYLTAGIAYDRPGIRISRMIEAIEIIQMLWSGDVFTFTGDHYQIKEATGFPLPFNKKGPPLIIGGGGKKVLTEAARRADIVGLNASLHSGEIGANTAQSALAERFIERRTWVEEAAGDRFADLELQLNTFMVSVTQTSKEADELFENLAPVFGVTPEQAREIPLVLAGTVNDICEQLQHRREVYGVSYIVFPSTEIYNLAPVVERLVAT